jgi:hypothetical protein
MVPKLDFCGEMVFSVVARGLIFRHCLLAKVYAFWPSPLYQSPPDCFVFSLEGQLSLEQY